MEIMVEFILVAEDFPVDEVHFAIGIAEGKKESREEAQFPTQSGDAYVRAKECSITYSSGYIETTNAEKPIKIICDMLLPKERQIVECIEKCELTAKFCVTINLTDNPAIELSREFIELASKLHAGIEFDSYVNYDDDGNLIVDKAN